MQHPIRAHYMIVNMAAIDVCTHNKGVLSFEESFGEFISDPVRFFGCHLVGFERLANLICDDIMFLRTSGTNKIFSFIESEPRRCGDRVTLIGRN